jgi:hypothetical protein
MKYPEHVLTLINAPSCVIAEGIATSALETVLTNDELEDWYREELLPRAGMSHVDAKIVMEVDHVEEEMADLWGNAAFMLHDQNKSAGEISSYLQQYGLNTEKEVDHTIRFISDPLSRSYIFTYHIGHDLLEELFAHGDRVQHFRRLLNEPVTPSQIRAWIKHQHSVVN